MSKIFSTLIGNIAIITINLEQMSTKLNSEDINFADLININNKLDKEEQNLNKNLNLINKNKFNDLELAKLQQAIDLESDRIKNMQLKIKELQKTLSPYKDTNYIDARKKIHRRIKQFNKTLKTLKKSNEELFSQVFNDLNQAPNKELLIQLKTLKNHIKLATTTQQPEHQTSATEAPKARPV